MNQPTSHFLLRPLTAVRPDAGIPSSLAGRAIRLHLLGHKATIPLKPRWPIPTRPRTFETLSRRFHGTPNRPIVK